MISISRLKYYASLKQKKYRSENKRFLAEGEKIVRELLANKGGLFKIIGLIADNDFLSSTKILPDDIEIIEANSKDLHRISSLDSPNHAIVEMEMSDHDYSPEDLRTNTGLFYEDIQDPGNFGTIIRTADWFGVKNIFCSLESVEIYNPKVIQASMGSFSRVKVHKVNPSEFLDQLEKFPDILRVAAVMEGDNLYKSNIPVSSMIFFGNESRGLSESISSRISKKVTIPASPGSGAESLNVGLSSAIILAEMKRKEYYSK
jgi:TrmH family RNA methyltransferase